MTIRMTGHFRELERGDATLPSIEACVGALDPAEREACAQYLSGGAMIATTGRLLDDWFDGTRRVVPQEVRTDGEWVWPEYFRYYVARYGVEVEPDFKAHMARRGWVATPLSAEQRHAVIEEIFAERGPG